MLFHEELTGQIIGAAIEVHRELGPGLLESAYHACMCRELSLRGVPFEQKVPLAIDYKGVRLECAYEMDFLVDRKVVVDLKAVSEMHPVFEVQLHTYLKLSKCRVGLLINFHVSGPQKRNHPPRAVKSRELPSLLLPLFSVQLRVSVVTPPAE